jgi:hypothetical protein
MSAAVEQRRKNKPIMTLAIVLLLLTLLSPLFVSLTHANPYLYYEPVSPPSDVKPPIILISSLMNNTVYASTEISLTLNVSIPEPAKYGLYLTKIRYQMDWKESITTLYLHTVSSGEFITDFSGNLTLAEIPDGSHNITFVISSLGGYGDGLTGKYFNLANYLTIYFSVDTASPMVSVLFDNNRTYESSGISLNFTINEPFTQVSYSLDGLDNVTINGNTTLVGLPVGMHNVTVYAWDAAGNVGASETIPFTIAEPFNVAPIVVASAASVAVVSVAFLLYFKKRKH